MRNLYQRDAGGSSADQKRGGNPNLIVHPLHAKYKVGNFLKNFFYTIIQLCLV